MRSGTSIMVAVVSLMPIQDITRSVLPAGHRLLVTGITIKKMRSASTRTVTGISIMMERVLEILETELWIWYDRVDTGNREMDR